MIAAPADIQSQLGVSPDKQEPVKDLADQYEKLISETPEVLDTMPAETVKLMEQAYDQKYKVNSLKVR